MPVKKIVIAGSEAFTAPLAEVISSKKVGSASIAGSCELLVSQLTSLHYDIVLLDLCLASELASLLSDASRPDVPVVPAVIIVYSGSFPELSDMEQRVLPIRGYLREPVDTDLLEAMMLRGEKKTAPVAVTAASGTALESLLDSPEQARKVIAVFRQQVPTMLQQMDDLIAEQNWPKLEILVHKMKAGYGYVGAQDIHKVLSAWEREIRAGEDPSRYTAHANDLRMRTYTLLGELAIRYAVP